MESKVFVSYSRKDLSEVKSIIVNIEESLGIKCWIDLKGIKSSSVYEDEVINAIESCEIVLFMVSPNSIASEYVRSEINYALCKERRIILICLNDSHPDKWALIKFPNVDYIRASNEDHMNKLIHDMEGWLGIQAIGPVLKELSKLYEDWEKLEHEQAGILQDVIEKEKSIGNRDTSVSEKIKMQSKDEERLDSLSQENEKLKDRNEKLVEENKKLVEEKTSLSNMLKTLKEEKSSLVMEISSLKNTISQSTSANSLKDGSLLRVSNQNIRLHKLNDYFYGYNNYYFKKINELPSIVKEEGSEINGLKIDVPTAKEIIEIVKYGSVKPDGDYFWIRSKGKILAFNESHCTLIQDYSGGAIFIYIVRTLQ